jgi:glycosyltransferase involved in cell wall biosynthesis
MYCASSLINKMTQYILQRLPFGIWKYISGWKVIQFIRRCRSLSRGISFYRVVPSGQVVNLKDIPTSLSRTKGKKLLFDLLFTQGGRHGGGEWGKSVLSNLLERVSLDAGLTIYVAMDPGLELDKALQEQLFSKPRTVKLIPVNTIDQIRAIVNTDRFDIFFTPAIVVYTQHYAYLKQAGGDLNFFLQHTKVVAPLLDVRDLDLAEDFERIFQHRKRLGCRHENRLGAITYAGLKEAHYQYRESLGAMYKGIIEDKAIRVVITLSDYCKNRMVDALNLDEVHAEKIQVFYPEMKIKSTPQPLDGPINFSIEKFILASNIGRKEKNGAAIVRAMDELAAEIQFRDYHFVLTGIRHLDELDLDIRHRDKFIHYHFLAPGHLEYLYQHATCLVFASLNEGFGLPPMEAMVYDTPCVVSNVTALPEIYGDGVEYCDPYRVSSIKAAIQRVLVSPPMLETRRRVYLKIAERQNRDSIALMEQILDFELQK